MRTLRDIDALGEMDVKKSSATAAFSLAFAGAASADPKISGAVRFRGLDNRPLVDNERAGIKGESRRIEGVALNLSDIPCAIF